MNDLGVHLLLFLVVSLAIVVVSAFYSDTDDAAAFRTLPRRLTTFVVGCAVLTAIVLACEALFASVV